MAETKFTITWPEMEGVLSLLVDEFGAWFVPDHNPERPEPIRLRSASDVAAHYQKVGYPERLHVLSESWTIAPLVFREILAKERRFFSAALANGGPAFEPNTPYLVGATGQFATVYEVPTDDLIGYRWMAGSLFDRSVYYRSPAATTQAAARGAWADGDILERPSSMVEAHKAVRKLVRAKAIPSSDGKFVGPTISPAALSLSRCGISFGKWQPKQKGRANS